MGKVLVVLVLGVLSYVTKIEVERKCCGAGLYCWAIDYLEREGADNDSENYLTIGSWNVCGFTTDK